MTDMTYTRNLTEIIYATDLHDNVVQRARILLELDEMLDAAWDDAITMTEWVETEKREAELLAGFVTIR